MGIFLTKEFYPHEFFCDGGITYPHVLPAIYVENPWMDCRYNVETMQKYVNNPSSKVDNFLF